MPTRNTFVRIQLQPLDDRTTPATFTWKGAGPVGAYGADLSNPLNWVGNASPPADGTADVIFPVLTTGSYKINNDIGDKFASMTFQSNGYSIDGSVRRDLSPLQHNTGILTMKGLYRDMTLNVAPNASIFQDNNVDNNKDISGKITLFGTGTVDFGNLSGSGSIILGKGSSFNPKGKYNTGKFSTAVDGTVTIQGGATLQVEVTYGFYGSPYYQALYKNDSLFAGSGVTLAAGAKLDSSLTIISSNITPTLGDTLIVIDNASSNPINGTFSGLPEGSIFAESNGKYWLRISYKGGDGNDVTLTTTSAPSDTATFAAWDKGWVVGVGGYAYSDARRVAVDDSGNVYYAGIVNDIFGYGTDIDFDPSSNNAYVSALNSHTSFIAKYTSSGGLMWVKTLSSNTTPILSVDAVGNVYMTGTFTDIQDFDPGDGYAKLTSQYADGDAFVSKIDASGSLVWVKSIPSVSYGNGNHSGNAVTTDSLGNVYTISQKYTPGKYITLVTKYNLQGNTIWQKSFAGSTGTVQGISLAVDSLGNVYSTGTFNNTVDFDPGTGVANLTAVGMWGNVFLTKLDSFGDYAWAKSFSAENVTGIILDGAGNPYLTGTFGGTVDFDPGPAIVSYTAFNYSDAYVSRFDTNGLLFWARRFGGGSSRLNPASIAVDSDGYVYTAGTFQQGTVDFDPLSGTYYLSSGVGITPRLYVNKLDPLGQHVWTKSVLQSYSDSTATGLSVDPSRNVFIAGYGGSMNFAPGVSAQDGYLTRFTAPIITLSTIADQAITAGQTIAPITFTIADTQYAASTLSLSVSSSNPILLPQAAMLLGGSGANRTLTLQPVPGQSGTATITITVTDPEGIRATRTFQLTVSPVAVAATAIFSTSPNGTYSTGQSIPLTVTFSQPLTLSGGNMLMNLDTGATISIVPFSGSSATVTYTIAPGQTSPDLNVTSLALASGAVLTTTAGHAVALTVPPDLLANSANFLINPLPPTTMSNVIVNADVIQRSRLTSIVLSFSTPVDAAQLARPNVITLNRTIGPPALVQTGASGSNGRILVNPPTGLVTSATLTFDNANGVAVTSGVESGSLSDGRWQLSIPYLQYTSSLNAPSLRRLFGDANNDGTVNAQDLAEFGNAFGTTDVNSPFDYNNDGTINAQDFAEFGNRFGVTL